MHFICRFTAFIAINLFFYSAIAQSQEFQILDGIIGVVGDEIILQSELNDRILQEQMQGKSITPNDACLLFEDVLLEKLLLHHAKVDSLEVGDAEVMDEIDRRLAYYINMFGSIEAFEAEYGKSVAQWKDDFGKPIENAFSPKKATRNQSKNQDYACGSN